MGIPLAPTHPKIHYGKFQFQKWKLMMIMLFSNKEFKVLAISL